MKKNDCLLCLDKSCHNCTRHAVQSNGVNIDPDLYAAEFMLYAFHFQQDPEQKRSNTATRAIPLMIMATEG